MIVVLRGGVGLFKMESRSDWEGQGPTLVMKASQLGWNSRCGVPGGAPGAVATSDGMAGAFWVSSLSRSSKPDSTAVCVAFRRLLCRTLSVGISSSTSSALGVLETRPKLFRVRCLPFCTGPLTLSVWSTARGDLPRDLGTGVAGPPLLLLERLGPDLVVWGPSLILLLLVTLFLAALTVATMALSTPDPAPSGERRAADRLRVTRGETCSERAPPLCVKDLILLEPRCVCRLRVMGLMGRTTRLSKPTRCQGVPPARAQGSRLKWVSGPDSSFQQQLNGRDYRT